MIKVGDIYLVNNDGRLFMENHYIIVIDDDSSRIEYEYLDLVREKCIRETCGHSDVHYSRPFEQLTDSIESGWLIKYEEPVEPVKPIKSRIGYLLEKL
jgi:hypothetical protein